MPVGKGVNNGIQSLNNGIQSLNNGFDNGALLSLRWLFYMKESGWTMALFLATYILQSTSHMLMA